MNGEDTPAKAPRRNKAGLKPPWQPGQSGNPAGRPKGARAKLGEDFIAALLKDFTEAGPAAISLMRAEKPNEYAKMIASILPKEIEGNFNIGLGEALDALDNDDD